MWNKKANQLDTGLTVWSCPLTTTMTLTCSLKVKVWNSFIWGMGVGALIDMERKGCELIIHDHDRDPWATMVGWVDVLYNDWVTSDVGVSSTYLVMLQLPVCPLASDHFYPSALQAGGVLSSRCRRAGGLVGGRSDGRLPDLRNTYLCNCMMDFLRSKFYGIV